MPLPANMLGLCNDAIKSHGHYKEPIAVKRIASCQQAEWIQTHPKNLARKNSKSMDKALKNENV